MSDRELLEFAAKAYWGAEIDDTCSVRWLDKDECIGYMHGDNQDHNGSDVELCWNPLEWDHDALPLAVKLYLWEAIRMAHRDVSADVDIYTATRRAIVRAAAEIGKAMP